MKYEAIFQIPHKELDLELSLGEKFYFETHHTPPSFLLAPKTISSLKKIIELCQNLDISFCFFSNFTTGGYVISTHNLSGSYETPSLTKILSGTRMTKCRRYTSSLFLDFHLMPSDNALQLLQHNHTKSSLWIDRSGYFYRSPTIPIQYLTEKALCVEVHIENQPRDILWREVSQKQKDSFIKKMSKITSLSLKWRYLEGLQKDCSSYFFTEVHNKEESSYLQKHLELERDVFKKKENEVYSWIHHNYTLSHQKSIKESPQYRLYGNHTTLPYEFYKKPWSKQNQFLCLQQYCFLEEVKDETHNLLLNKK